MSFFDYSVPLLRPKQPIVNIDELDGLWFVNWKIGKKILYSTFYTRIDQACLFWSLLLIPMFFTAQFLSVDWSLQAILWTILSFVGVAVMVTWTRYWVNVREVGWILYCWIILMLSGLILTDFGIFFGWDKILLNLCPLWLGLSALGYLCTAFAVRSRAVFFIGILHILGILLLPYISEWQFISTGALMVFCLLLLAEFQWDGL